MKRNKSKIWQFLESSGVLEKGNESEIKAVRREYRKKYYLEYKRKAREEKPEYTILLSKKNGEYDRIKLAAKRHKRTITRFIRESALAYIEQRFLVPDPIRIAEVEILLSDCLNEIKTIIRPREKYFWERDQRLEEIEKRIERLEKQIDETLRNPPIIHDYQNKIT